ncbi:MAG TPA: orotidine-5'-phosphate decarboxylase [Gemmatimonadales bacterium]|nr:orotidine-5'-phosphate decarboxylase [Gemmatimonadales bacterium]
MAELIVAFDLGSGTEALTLADKLPGLRWAKIGSALFVREGPALVREFTARNVRVFLDLKWHDIPSTVERAVGAARELGVGMATVHCLGGHDMLVAAVRAAGDLPLVGVTVLTSHSSTDLEQIVGRGVPDMGLEGERLARIAREAGLRGVVAGGREIGIVRGALGQGPWIVVPGVRLAGDSRDDQARTVTPREAVRLGATHLVVGRSITRAADPAVVYQQILDSI